MEDLTTTAKEIIINDNIISEFAFSNKANEANYLISISRHNTKEEAKMQLGEVEKAVLLAVNDIPISKDRDNYRIDMSPSGEFLAFCIINDNNIYICQLNKDKDKLVVAKKIETPEKLGDIK